MRKIYWKSQTAWVRRPPVLKVMPCDPNIGIGIYPEYAATGKPPREPALIFLSPHEAQAFAAWVSDLAERMIAKQARAAARRAAKEAKP